jgi:protein translocase SecG subunit
VIASILAASAAPIQAATAAATRTLSPEQQRALQEQFQRQFQNQLNPSRSPLAQHFPWLTHTFAGIFIVAALLLVLLLAVQTTKQEGLSGTIGGRVESAYRGRLAGDTQIARWTTYIAITFILFGTLLSLSGI